jgi:hypothetical protein
LDHLPACGQRGAAAARATFTLVAASSQIIRRPLPNRRSDVSLEKFAAGMA